jgi:hypothetical protein
MKRGGSHVRLVPTAEVAELIQSLPICDAIKIVEVAAVAASAIAILRSDF